MDCTQVGNLLCRLRKERKMTQRELAELLYISDKAVSKWERGQGCPDISLLRKLSAMFAVNIEKILSGDLGKNETEGGNMKGLKFYTCPGCGSVLTGLGNAEVSCCGRKLPALAVQTADEGHECREEEIENDMYVTFSHEMSKQHYLSFAAHVSYDRVLLVKLYPEQNAEVRFPKMHGAKLYFHCNQHGLWTNKK